MLLDNALRQTGWAGSPLTETDWRAGVRERLKEIDWDRIVADVRPFLEIASEADLLTMETVEKLLESPLK